MVAQTCKPSTFETEARKSRSLSDELETSLGYEALSQKSTYKETKANYKAALSEKQTKNPTLFSKIIKEEEGH